MNAVLEIMHMDSIDLSAEPVKAGIMQEILDCFTADMVKRGLVDDNSTACDLFGTNLMGTVTACPS